MAPAEPRTRMRLANTGIDGGEGHRRGCTGGSYSGGRFMNSHSIVTVSDSLCEDSSEVRPPAPRAPGHVVA